MSKGGQVMKTMEQSWGKFLPRALVLGAIIAASVFVAIRAANAREGEAGGHTRTALTMAGSLTVPQGVTPHLTFVFEKGTPPVAACTVTNATTRYDVTARTFSAEIPIETCPGTLFDGANVTVTTVVRNGSAMGAELLRVERQPVNPVPYARYADQYGTPDCPVGYTRENPTDVWINCRRGADEIVRVGTGASAFWIDRFEASVWEDAAGTRGIRGEAMTPFGTEGDDYGDGFPDNGQWFRASVPQGTPRYALSRGSVQPSRNITWFQSQEACRLSGKRLPTGEEWLAAAAGTPDPPSANDGFGNFRCHTMGGRPRVTDRGRECRSRWVAEDMIGNLSEWTNEWQAGLGDSRIPYGAWPGELYGSDRTVNIASTTNGGAGIPAAALRGGDYTAGLGSGIFFLDLNNAPSYSAADKGFRCVIPR
jgi:formylglycine-generating enzyme required for sulfatase activity